MGDRSLEGVPGANGLDATLEGDHRRGKRRQRDSAVVLGLRGEKRGFLGPGAVADPMHFGLRGMRTLYLDAELPECGDHEHGDQAGK